MKQPQKHEVVISGIAGIFPECGDVDELWTKLISADENMVTLDDRRWVPGQLGVPAGLGKLKEPNFFDLSFFGVNRRLCQDMDPLHKLSLEQSFRAVCDAGVNPAELSGANVAVFMASCISETEYDCVIRGQYMGMGMLGHSRTMQANRVSYFMNLRGPSFQMDSSWCGGIQGLQHAHDLISTGLVTSAIVGACSLIFTAPPSYHYQAMGNLSQDCKTRSFSADASGYARSEGCATFFLQRKEHARRSYGSILAALSMNYGSRENPLTALSEKDFKRLLVETYKRAKTSPNEVAYLEAAGNASKEKDARELRAVSDMLLTARDKPLQVGCIKSNLGHCEAAAGMVGAVKLALMLDRGLIPPNINYSSPNPDVPALVSGKMQVVTKITQFEGTIAATTELGVAGQFSHMVVKRHEKVKKNRCVKGELPPDGLPRLVLMSDRSKENLSMNRERLRNMAVDEEFVCLMNHVYKDGIKNHLYRGYTVLNGENNNFTKIDKYEEEVTRRPVWFMFSGMGSQWPAMGKSLMRIPVFADRIEKCHTVLAPKGVNVLEILTKDDPSMFDNILHSFVGIAAVQLGLVDVLKTVGVEPDGIIGHSVGELGCAYADGCLSAKQVILSAHARGRASIETELIQGMMAAVGMGNKQLENEIPETIEVACHNSESSCTLSGPTKDMETYIEKLKKKGVFAKLVNVANIAYHSRYIKPAAPTLLRYLKGVIPEPKARTSRWISTSIPESRWGEDLAKTSSAEYHTNNLLGSVLFEEASTHIPHNAIVIEIAPHGLLQAIVKRSMPKATHIPLTSRFEEDNAMHLFGALGKMYTNGVAVDVQKLYPPVQFPVSRGTAAISPFIGWQHDEEFKVLNIDEKEDSQKSSWREYQLRLTEEKYSNLRCYKIKQRIVLPPSFYIDTLLELYSGHDFIAIDHFEYLKETEIPHSPITFVSDVHRGSGYFCFSHMEELVCKGRIVSLEKSPAIAKQVTDENLTGDCLSGEEVSSYMNSMGLSLIGRFASIKKLSIKDHLVRAIIKWNGSVTEFLNSVFTVVGFYDSTKESELRIVTRATRITIDLASLNSSSDVFVEYNAITKFIKSSCVQVLIPTTSTPVLASLRTKNLDYAIETYEYVPFSNSNISSIDQILYICSQLVIENLPFQSHDKAYTVGVVSIGKETSFNQALETVCRLVKGPHLLQVTSVSEEDEFLKRDMSFIQQEIIWFVSSSKPSKKILQSLNSALHGFILMPKANVKESTEINVMMEFQYKGMSYLFGSTKINQKYRNYTIVHTGERYLEVLNDKLEKAAKDNWKGDQDTNFVILAGKLQSITSTIAVIEESNRLPHKNLLRFLFSDQDLPRHILDDNHYKNQMLKDLKQNIFVGGVWGSLRLLSTSFKPTLSMKEFARKEKFIYPLNSVMSTSGVTAVGLNLTDVTGTRGNDSLGIFDYATPTTIGFGQYNANTNTFVPDRILKWDRPKSWMDGEAATVPLLYSLAATIVYLKQNALRMDDNDTILVTNGLLPLSQAIITLALQENHEVFVTVGSVGEKTELLAQFPRLKSQNILDHNRNDLYVHIHKLKGGRGVAKAVSMFGDRNKVEACVKSLDSEFGIAILVSQGPMDGRSKLGLSVFITEALVVGVTPETVINSSDEEKLELRDKVQTLISNGVIQPIKTYATLPSNTLNVDAIDYLQKIKSKVVVPHKNYVRQNTEDVQFICDEMKNYVIMCGQHQLDLWLDLAEWLLKRNARKLTVFFIQTALSTTTNLRYQSLSKQYYGAKINLHSMKYISTKPAMKSFFEELGYRDGIDTIFFIGTDLRAKIQEIDTALEHQRSKCRIVCLGHGGETVCHNRNEQGLSSLCVRCSTDALRSPDVLRYLDQLIMESTHRPIVLLTEKLFSSDNKNTGHSQLIPDTLPELIELLRLSDSQLCFSNVFTHTSRLPHIKEISPVFLFPGLKPHQTSPLCNALYFPVLEARLPEECENVEHLASKLVELMISHPIKFFTLVADGWGGILALHIGARLEALGKLARVILLDGAPQLTVTTASELLKDETALIDRFLKLSSKVTSLVRGKGTWNEKLRTAIEGSHLSEEDGLIAIKSINLLRNRLLAVLSCEPPQNKIKTKCHLIEYGPATQESAQRGLDKYLTREHTLHLKESDTSAAYMALAAEDVNSLVTFEYADSANPPLDNRSDIQICTSEACF